MTFPPHGGCKPSQLYSHWQKQHAENPAAAKQLEKRWRNALTNCNISRVALGRAAALERSSEEMEGPELEGFELMCDLQTTSTKDHEQFPHDFDYNLSAFRAWVAGTGSI